MKLLLSGEANGDTCVLDDLRSCQLRKNLEVRIPCKQDQRMLQDESGDPDIVRRDGRALLPQLPVNGGVVMCRLVVGIEHTYARLEEEPAQNGFVPRSLRAHRTQSSEHDEGQPHFIGELNGSTTDALPRQRSVYRLVSSARLTSTSLRQ
jgi:hypothetical protein